MDVLRSSRRFLAAGLALALPFCLTAQQKSPTPPDKPAPSDKPATLSVDARLVNLPVVVRDKKGALVQNFGKDDFTLQVDGKPQTIRYFDKDANLPLILGLLVDTSVSQRSVLDEERSASGVFLDQILKNPNDQAFVIQFSSETELLQDLTSSRPKLQAALKEIDTPGNTSSNSPDDNNDNSSRRAHRGTVLYDSLFLAADEVTSKQKGRKAIVILSDGADSGSRENITRAIEAAQRADTAVYAIYFKGDEQPQQRSSGPVRRGGGYPGGGYPGGGYPGRYPGGYPGGYPGSYPGGGGTGGNYPTSGKRVDGKKVLERIAGETGGRVFEIKKNQDVAQLYNQIADELRAQFRLGFTPDQAASSSGYHQVNLDIHQKNYTVQTRDGYYGSK